MKDARIVMFYGTDHLGLAVNQSFPFFLQMSKSDFVRINSSSGQPGTEDNSAPVELLEDLYDRIVNNEIKLKDEGANPGGVSKAPVSAGPLGVLNLALPRGRNSTVETTGEGDEIVRRTQALFKTQQHGKVFQKVNGLGKAFSTNLLDEDGRDSWHARVTVSFRMGHQDRFGCTMGDFRFILYAHNPN